MTTIELQRTLKALGYDPGPLDGIAGPRTRAAVVAFQRAQGLAADGIVGPKTLAAIAAARVGAPAPTGALVHTWRSLENWQTETDGVVAMPPAGYHAMIERVVTRWGSLLRAKGEKYSVPFELMAAVCAAESAGDPTAGSYAGAQGLMQIMPFHFPAGMTREQMCEPDRNVDKGAELLGKAIARHGKNVPHIAATYNAGGVYAAQGSEYDARDDWGFKQNHEPKSGRAYATNVTEFCNLLVAKSSGRTNSGEVLVMLLGDSLTQGYAPELAKLLPPYVRLVGRERAYGVACEAYPGATIDEIARRFGETSSAPDVVVSLAGTNDVAGKGGNWTVEQMSAKRASMVQAIATRGVAAQLLVAISPMTSVPAARSALVAPYNDATEQIAKVQRAAGRAVAWVDPHVSVRELTDGVHGGFRTIAQAIAARLIPIVDEIRRQRSGGASSSSVGSALVIVAGLALVALALGAL